MLFIRIVPHVRCRTIMSQRCQQWLVLVSIWQLLWVLKLLIGNMHLLAFSPCQSLFTCYFVFYFKRNEFIMCLTCYVHYICMTYTDDNKRIINTLRFSHTKLLPQSKYPVLHQGTFGGTGILFLGRLGSRANTEKKGSRPIMSNFLGCFFSCFGQQKFFF